MSDWTPGPWVPVAESVVKFGPEEDQPGYLTAHTIAEAQRPGDARLMAAAPEMFELLCWARFELLLASTVIDSFTHDDTTKGMRKELHNVTLLLTSLASEIPEPIPEC